jgi:pyruvate dehydrogenase E1 component beta subunit
MFFEHRMLYGTRGPVPDGDASIPFGKAVVRREGSAVTVVAWQMMLSRALEAANILERENIDIEIIDPRTLNPFDRDAVLASVRKTGACIVVEEGYRSLGVGAEIGALLFEEAFGFLEKPFKRLAVPDVPISSATALSNRVTPSVDDICAAVRSVVS